MAEKTIPKSRKRKHFEIDKNRQSPFQNQNSKKPSASVVSKAPRGINVVEFAESRALEIQNMMLALSNASGMSNKRVFQSVPRHMRRRAASHNSKRMPVRLREAYKREAAKSQEKMKESNKKKKSRRQRRRPSNLLAEYNRRQRKYVWLETHIWHAKRFKMAEQWGYKIPLHPNDKSVRASYRAMATGCLMQDISYYQCIEVSGKQAKIVAAMKHLTDSDAGLTMAAKQYLNGSREGHVVLYKCDKYPWNAIGPVRFLWQQHLSECYEDRNLPGTTSNDSTITKLWVWSHPACRDDVLSEVVRACSLEGHTELEDMKQAELREKTLESSQENKVASESEVSSEPPEFSVNVLAEQLVRFRFTGPKSHALIASTVELCDWRITGDGVGEPGHRWWQRYSRDQSCQKNLMDQNALWEQMKDVASPGALVAGSVVALVVKDPRLGLPVRKSSIDMNSDVLYKERTSNEPTFTSCAAGSAVSPLWDSSVRDEVKRCKLPEKDLNEYRSKLTVPGSKLDLGDDTSRIPILVIQRPGTRGDSKTGSISFGCGYDAIIPAGWSMAFWIAFVYRGARVGGTRESASCSREQALPHFPRDFPDTKTGWEYIEEQSETGEEKHVRYPPAKRPNYEKLGVSSPFRGDWERLVSEWSGEVCRLEVEMGKVAAKEKYEEEQTSVFDGKLNDSISVMKQRELGEAVVQAEDGCKRLHTEVGEVALASDHISAVNGNGMSGADVDSDSSSEPCSDRNFFVIRSCVIRRRLQQVTQSLQNAISAKTKKFAEENACGDHIEFLRTNLGTCRRSLVCLDLLVLFKGCPLVNAIIFIPTREDLQALKKDKNYGGPVERVHRSQKSENSEGSKSSCLLSGCSRTAIGFVSSGQYSFARGQGAAVGFCTFPGFCEVALMAWREKWRPLVLVRNTTSSQYRFASFTVV